MNRVVPSLGLLLLVCACSIVPTPTPYSTPTPFVSPTDTPLPNGEFLAFQSNREGNWEIYLGDLQGGRLFNLTNNPAEDRAPAWSPDGNTIAFESHRDGNWELYTLDVTTGAVTRLSNDLAYDGAPAWSPDGKKIAFESYRDGNLEIYSLDMATAALQRLTDDPAGDYAPLWSPDGRSILFVSWREGNKDILMMNADGSEQRNLTSSPDDEEYPVWSPDGQSIAFLGWRDQQSEIYIMNADGTGTKQLTENDVQECCPTWSSDGRSLFFAIYDKGEPFEVYHEFRGGHFELASVPVGGGSIQYIMPSRADDTNPDIASLALVSPAWAREVEVSTAPAPIPTFSPPTGPPPYHIVTLENISDGGPYRLEERAAASFNALRREILAKTGWDYLGMLSDAFRPIDMQARSRYSYFSWHKTGRTIDLRFELLNESGKQQLELVREDIGTETYWHMYIKCAVQDGTLGEPLKRAPWQYWWLIDPDLEPEAYSHGGRPKPIPSGYFEDFTAAARRLGWERIASYTTSDYHWYQHTLRTEYWHYQYMEGLLWYQAMLEIYPDGMLRQYFTWEKAREFDFPDDLPQRKGIPP